eukprot:gene131-4377_t
MNENKFVDDLKNVEDLNLDKLPPKYTRDKEKRIFVNRAINLDKIEYFGFDMDYTLAVYLPEFDKLQYEKVVERLITKKGYPKELENLKFDPNFAIRGVYVDKKLGNILKIDQFGYILSCVHGKKKLDYIKKDYPDRFLHPASINERFYCMDTLFSIPEICLYGNIIDYFEENDYIKNINYASIFEDIRQSQNGIHQDGTLKNQVIKEPSKYIRKDKRLNLLLDRLRKSNKKVFLLTNSEYYYSSAVMKFMLEGTDEEYKSWKDYFDIIIVSACKPSFFMSGTTLREVNEETGNLKFNNVCKFEKGKVYNGGNLSLFKKFTETSGSEVLYIGDNISHDIVHTKENKVLWRTCLIVKEIEQEIETWSKSQKQFEKINKLEYLRAQIYQGMDSLTKESPNTNELKKEIKNSIEEFENQFNIHFGSIFRGGTSESYFSSLVVRYADLYCSDHFNFLNYPFFYYFRPLHKYFAHEMSILK